MKVRDIIAVIEEFAPLSIQEGWDNSGLCVGSPDDEVTSALFALDCTEELVDEAIGHMLQLTENGASLLVITHDLFVAQAIADKIVFFKDGKSACQVTREEFANTSDFENLPPYAKLLFESLPCHKFTEIARVAAEDGQIHYDMLLPLSVFIFLWTNDTGAYCSGSLFGKHKLFPRISPAKSWEGSIGGGIFVLIAAAIVGYFANSGETLHTLNIPEWMGLGLVVAVFGTWGDLVESLFKRTIGVKDSGNILPGHGGMLDRFDSSLMAIPAAVIYLYTLQLFG